MLADTERSGAAITPPLKHPIGVVMPRGSTSLRMPRGGRLLMIAKSDSARAQFATACLGACGQDLVIGHQSTIDIRDDARRFFADGARPDRS